MSKNALKLLVLWLSSGFTVFFFALTSKGDGCRSAFCTRTIPKHDYQSAVIPQRGTVASYPFQPGSIPDEPNTKVKVFRPLTNDLTVGDCTLSNLRLQLYSDSQYILSFKVTNAAKTAEPAQPVDVKKNPESKREDTGVQVVPVRHHRLVVTARLYDGAAVVPANNTKQVEGVVVAKVTEGPILITAREQVTLRFNKSAVSTRQFNEAKLAEFELEVDPESVIRASEEAVPVKRASSHCRCLGHL